MTAKFSFSIYHCHDYSKLLSYVLYLRVVVLISCLITIMIDVRIQQIHLYELLYDTVPVYQSIKHDCIIMKCTDSEITGLNN